MKHLTLTPLAEATTAEVMVPGCLSYTVRALNIAAMVSEPVTIRYPTKSDDSYAMVGILQTLGVHVEEQEDAFVVHGSIDDVEDKEYVLDVNISGRTARTSLALLCVVPGVKTLTCKEAFKKRPVHDLVDGLRQLGAEIEYLEKDGHLPVKIHSSTLEAGEIMMRGEVSSQYFSAIMMIAPRLNGEVTINVIGEQTSKPFIDLTIDVMQAFGVHVQNDDYKQYTITLGQTYHAHEYIVEADAIAAGYFWGIAAVTGSTIRVLHLPPQTKQGDAYLADVFGSMGCIVRKNEEERWIEVEGPKDGNLQGVTVDMNAAPDSTLALAAVAACAQGMTHITNIANLKVKETDRIEAPKAELMKMNIRAESTHDSLTIYGGKPKAAGIETYGDGRMAMAFAILGARIPGVMIHDPDVVSKSFPHFWDSIQRLGVGVL